MKKIVSIALKVLWVIIFVCIGYDSYGISGDGNLLYLLISLIITFPSGVLAAALISTMTSIVPASHMYDIGNIAATFIFFLVGYCQWFILLPKLWQSEKGQGGKKPASQVGFKLNNKQ